MTRAGIFIGVDRTGGLRTLRDAAAGARRMHEWALTQGILDNTHAKLITDADGAKVRPDQIYDAITELIDGPGVDQLVVYFAGHGVNINRGERWLLSDAPRNTSAAVNVRGSAELAAYCGIQHVVFVSDACRVAPEGIQAQNVLGVDIFPNDGPGDRAKPVDQFFACVLGRTAAEIQDADTAAENYTALYTGVLLEVLDGHCRDVLERLPADGAWYVRPDRLQAYLEAEVPRRVRERNLQNKVNQDPEAFILSRDSWLARIESSRLGPPPPLSGRPAEQLAPEHDLRRFTAALTRSAGEGDQAGVDAQLELAANEGVAESRHLARTVHRVAQPFGPDQVDAAAGIKVRGARVVDAHVVGADVEIGPDGQVLHIDELAHGAASVLLTFDSGVGTVIPALRGFLAALTFDGGDLVDVAYEPSANSWQWRLFQRRAVQVRALRAVAASSSQLGRFRIEAANAEQVAQQMQYAKSIDPTLAVYAAYAYHDLQLVDRIREMSSFLMMDINVSLFDVALLGRALIDKAVDRERRVVPFVPLLSQGWALLAAHRVRLHPALDGIATTTRDSLWSLYDENGLAMLARAMRTGEVR